VRKKVKSQLKHNGRRSYKRPPKINVDTLEISVIEAGITDYIWIVGLKNRINVFR